MFHHNIPISLKFIKINVLYSLKKMYVIENYFGADFKFTELLSTVRTSVYSTYVRYIIRKNCSCQCSNVSYEKSYDVVCTK